ncbi:hypothetical protein ACLOJK_005863 [Asimina triloba]
MCSSAKANNTSSCHAAVAQIDGRPVLQPACNRNAVAESKQNPKKKCPSKALPLNTTATNAANIAKASKLLPPPISPKYKDPNGLNSSSEKPATPRANAPKPVVLHRKNSRKCSSGVGGGDVGGVSHESLWNSASVVAAGSIAVARKEQVSLMQAQRKVRIAHYGRTPAKLEAKADQADSFLKASAAAAEEKRCSFITPNSDPLYIAYHDEEWGVPVHDDKAAFAGFDVETVANSTEKQIVLMSADCGLDLNKVRGAVDNANRILQVNSLEIPLEGNNKNRRMWQAMLVNHVHLLVKKERGSFNKYLWDFVKNKPISTQYKSCRKIPVKTSKSETISKDMVRKGFRKKETQTVSSMYTIIRAAFAGFDVETVANSTEKQIVLMSADCGLDLNKVRGAVDNANRILQVNSLEIPLEGNNKNRRMWQAMLVNHVHLLVKKERGSFNKYLWDFVKNKPISTQYKSCRKIPVKTSKSETISKDMVRKGFRYVGPMVVHSFMQAVGLTNDHLISCPCHLQCIALASHHPTTPAL